jgi:hypothetical protein
MISRMTVLVFALSVIAITLVAWALFEHSADKATVLLLAMLFGGSIYFLLRTRK